MKKKIMKEVAICDECNMETDFTYTCNGCGKEFCYSCKEKAGKEFKHGVYCAGSGDGYYCMSCLSDKKIRKTEVFKAYQRIQSLRLESKYIYEDFEKRVKKAEDDLKKLTGNL